MDWAQKTLTVESPPEAWIDEDVRALEEIRCVPTDDPGGRICLRRDAGALVIEGGPEVSRIIGGGIASLAELPYYTNTVPTHVHFDPATDPEHRYLQAGIDNRSVGNSLGRKEMTGPFRQFVCRASSPNEGRKPP